MSSVVVVDASALARTVLDPTATELVEVLTTAEVHAPHLIDAEVVSVLRRQVRTEAIGPSAASDALRWMAALIGGHGEHR